MSQTDHNKGFDPKSIEESVRRDIDEALQAAKKGNILDKEKLAKSIEEKKKAIANNQTINKNEQANDQDRPHDCAG